MKKRSLVATTAALFCLFSGAADAVCTPHAIPVVDSSRAYVGALVDALVVLRSARDRSKDIRNATMPGEVIAAFENAKLEYQCAASYVSPYINSPSKAVQSSAQSFGVAVGKLEQVNDTFRQDFNDKLDGKSEKPSDQAERSGKLVVMGDDAWHFETNAMVAAAISLVEFDDEKKQRLILTSSERDLLVRRLERTFGVVANQKGHMDGLESSVSVFLDFLTDKGRKTSNAR